MKQPTRYGVYATSQGWGVFVEIAPNERADKPISEHETSDDAHAARCRYVKADQFRASR